MNWLEVIKLEDLPSEQRDIAETIGMDAYRRLISGYSGTTVYVALQDSVTSAARNREIFSDFNAGASFKKVARKFGLSERYVREIIRKIEMEEHHGK